jgi:hypothetical protein
MAKAPGVGKTNVDAPQRAVIDPLAHLPRGGEKFKSWRSGQWETVGRVPYRVNGNGLEISIPRAMVGSTNQPPAFDFHWADNIQKFDDASERRRVLDLSLGRETPEPIADALG